MNRNEFLDAKTTGECSVRNLDPVPVAPAAPLPMGTIPPAPPSLDSDAAVGGLSSCYVPLMPTSPLRVDEAHSAVPAPAFWMAVPSEATLSYPG